MRSEHELHYYNSLEMFETFQILLFGNQPVPKVSNQTLAQLIDRDFGNQAYELKQKLKLIKSDSSNGKNRISAAIIKLSNKDIKAVDRFVEIANNDFRDVISQAEYPRCSKLGFGALQKNRRKKIYLADWKEYAQWLKKD